MCAGDHHGSSAHAKDSSSAVGENENKESFPWQLGVFDAHCHPTDTMGAIKEISTMKAYVLTVMATREQDQSLVDEVAGTFNLERPELINENSRHVVPSFGWHPWFCHQLYDDTHTPSLDAGSVDFKVKHYKAVLQPQPTDDDIPFLESLPSPKSLSEYLSQTRAYLEKYPLALVGEIGLDKLFRLPDQWTPELLESRDKAVTPGSREGRRLTRFSVSMAHQRAILAAQLKLAGEMNRAASVHSVGTHGAISEALQQSWKGFEKEVLSKRDKKKLAKRPLSEDVESKATTTDGAMRSFPPRICMHSYTGSLEHIKPFLNPSVPAEVFFSFSSGINMEDGKAKAPEVIEALKDEQILIESDWYSAGKEMDDRLEEICREICRIRGWELQDGVKRLGQNWHKFIFGVDRP